MRTWKLVAGILSIVLCMIVLFQSCAVGIANTLEESGDFGGTAGLLVALLLLAGGIVSIATRNSREKGGSAALVILFGLAAALAFSNAAVLFSRFPLPERTVPPHIFYQPCTFQLAAEYHICFPQSELR